MIRVIVSAGLLGATAIPCLAQAPSWRQAPAVTAIANRNQTFDTARGRVVLVRGSPPPENNETWELVGDVWGRRSTPTAPRIGASCALAYDSDRRRVVLFGGEVDGDLSDQTWEWSGVEWSRRVTARTPPARLWPAMAYDSSRRRILMFGGWSRSVGVLTDTWEWDGVDWTRRTPRTSPSTGYSNVMIDDLARGRVVMFSAAVDETWEWSGQDWTRLSPARSPGRRSEPAFAYDAARHRGVLFGGLATGLLADTWEWNGNDWQPRTPATAPSARYSAAAMYDPARQRMILLGGYANAKPRSDLWEWDGTDWLERLPDSLAARGRLALAFDPVRGRVVGFGGGRGDDISRSRTDETVEWDGRAWSPRTTVASPTPRESHAMAWDPVSRRVLLFGGFDGRPAGLGDTWCWDGVSWTELRPASSPSPRRLLAMASDSGRRRVVLFGGVGTGYVDRDTWEWDGSDWIRHAHPAGPVWRYEHAMAYDAARRRTVMFGGSDGLRAIDDTWEWDGSNWARILPANSPPPRRGHAMVYDDRRQRVVLFGGANHAGELGDTWEWDGRAWSLTNTWSQPPRPGYAMAFDAVRERTVLFGDSYLVANTWTYGEHAPTSTQVIGATCAGSLGPAILVTGEPYLGNRAFAIDLVSAHPNAACVFGLAAAAAARAVGGCTLYLADPIMPVLAVTNAVGFATVRVPLPLDVRLRGAILHAQVFVDDPSPIGPLAFTAARRILVGD